MPSPRALVILAAAFAIFVVIGLTAQQLTYERQQATLRVRRENESRVQSFEQYVLRTLEVAELATRHVDHMTRLSPLRQSPDLFVDDQTIRSPVFTKVVINRGDFGIASTDSSDHIDPVANAQLLAIAQGARGKLTVTAPMSILGMRSQIAIVRDLPAAKNGFVAIFIDPRRFTQFADDITFAKEDVISLIGLDGVTRARRTGREMTAGEIVSGLVMTRQRLAPNGTYFGPSVLDHIPRYFSHRRLARFNLFATSGMPESLITERVGQRRKVQLGIMAAAILAIFALALLLLAFIRRRQEKLEQLFRSNRQLNEAQRIGSMGDWDYYPAVDELHWSENLRRMYGRESSEAISNLAEVSRYTQEAAFSRVHNELGRILETGKGSLWEIEVVLGSGERSCRRIVASPIVGEHGAIVGVHGTDQDITSEIKVRALENRLHELARLDSIRALAATFAHELNQPLGAAANYLGAATRLLDKRAGAHAKVAEYLESAKDQVEHMGQMIGSARDLVVHSGSNSQEAAVRKVLEGVILLLRGTEGTRQAAYRTEVGPGAETILANIAQLKQVLFNLSRNAIEAVPVTRMPSVEFAVSLNSDGLTQFEIADNGSGFPTSINDPFTTLSTTKESGLGLGLSLARTIVEAHGGRIWIKRSAPDGSTLAFTLQSSAQSNQ